MIYADASFFVALKTQRDTFHPQAVRLYDRLQDDAWIWSPWHRIEVFNSIRQLVLHPDSRRRLQLAEAKMAIHLLEEDVRVGYFAHKEADWRNVLRTANEISSAHGFTLPVRSADLLHVAYAVELSAQTFVSFDADQFALAQIAGLKTISPLA